MKPLLFSLRTISLLACTQGLVSCIVQPPADRTFEGLTSHVPTAYRNPPLVPTFCPPRSHYVEETTTTAWSTYRSSK